jgi:hypothetical protein
MKTGSASLFGKMCCGLSMSVLAFTVSLDGTRAVWAEAADAPTASLEELIVDPIMKTVRGLEQRLTSVEATVAAMADSFNSRRVAAQVLCVSDETGAQTCITKAQLDTLLSGISHAEVNEPATAVNEAKAVPNEDPAEAVVTKDESRYAEQTAPIGEKSETEQEPEHTGTIQSASSGAAIVLSPEIEVTEDPAPAEAAPPEAPLPSDD